ncbi:MAG: hypothetical protein ACI9J2_000660 [Saprospiraceae bacterium]|jgi:hypothetical protein
MLLSFIRPIMHTFVLFTLATSTAFATNILIVNNDPSNEGLNDLTSVEPVTGNSATTLGAQYLNVFQAAADYWEERLDSSITIRAGAKLYPLVPLDCDETSAVLGSAGPNYVYANFPNAPLTNTVYTAAQASSLANFDFTGGQNSLSMTFNNGIGTPDCLSGISWWLGINSAAPNGTISFYDTVLHELAHGLGFLTFVNELGEKIVATVDEEDVFMDDVFMTNLFDQSSAKSWPDMTDDERESSSFNTGNLVWNGLTVTQNSGYLTAGKDGSNVRIYAPSPYEPGSSVSHWDTTLAPDELMEPSATATSDDCATTSAFKDMGWTTKGVSFTQSTKTGYEAVGSVSISVNRPIVCAQEAVSVQVASTDGSAQSGSDYTSVSQTLNWASGETDAKTVTVTLFDDGLEELNGETFTLNLSNPAGGATLGSITSATITIQDKRDDDFCFPIKTVSGKVAIVCL